MDSIFRKRRDNLNSTFGKSKFLLLKLCEKISDMFYGYNCKIETEIELTNDILTGSKKSMMLMK